MSVYDDFRKGHIKFVMDQRISCTVSFTKKSVSDLLAVMIVVGLRKHFIALRMEKRVANFSLNLMSSCMVRMMIPS